eukprot:gnl/MRDRNA2_/MRDRNA2_137694_c0_seq1.p1 gnl/MRDRNA2_/MRDRNA2_137694_c0~~gnl/MRDRNA2_/MRDRNA2_137694_c0_seq1.p1  ORF type:complete len:273 (+),score=29.25 gnl/MRDRNA2_/MRDRNA2_137694_c0_seq1:143-961(+)
MVMPNIGLNDGVLMMSLLYSAFDILYEWKHFSQCQAPVNWWLVVSYLLVVIFRITHSFGQSNSNEGEDFLMNFRQRKAIPRALLKITWALVVPFFTVWTAVGSYWLSQVLSHTPSCLPMGAHPWFILFWQALSYLWIIVHIVFGITAMVLEQRIRRAENDVRRIEQDSDVVERWGRISDVSNYENMPWKHDAGLRPTEIEKMETVKHFGDAAECSICLNDVVQGENIRYLPGCGHLFHKSCIDLWMVRRADCPLCKCPVTKEHLKGLQGVSV